MHDWKSALFALRWPQKDSSPEVGHFFYQKSELGDDPKAGISNEVLAPLGRVQTRILLTEFAYRPAAG